MNHFYVRKSMWTNYTQIVCKFWMVSDTTFQICYFTCFSLCMVDKYENVYVSYVNLLSERKCSCFVKHVRTFFTRLPITWIA